MNLSKCLFQNWWDQGHWHCRHLLFVGLSVCKMLTLCICYSFELTEYIQYTQHEIKMSFKDEVKSWTFVCSIKSGRKKCKHFDENLYIITDNNTDNEYQYRCYIICIQFVLKILSKYLGIWYSVYPQQINQIAINGQLRGKNELYGKIILLKLMLLNCILLKKFIR